MEGAREGPKVSVLIPAYDAGEYISKALTSVLRQTEPDFEIIVVDDASTDDTVARVEAFDDPRIRLIQKRKNEGAQATRNDAMRNAEGAWIAFLDADDWYAPFRLERLLHHARSVKVDVVADNVYWASCDLSLSNVEGLYIDRFGQVAQLGKLFKGRFLRSLPRMIGPAEFMWNDMPGPRNPCFGLMKPLFRRAFLEEHQIRWDERVRYSQDTVFYLSCLVPGARFLVVPETGYFYRMGSDGITNSADEIEAAQHRLEVNRRLIDEWGAGDAELKKVLEKRDRKYRRQLAYFRYRRFLQEGARDFIKHVRAEPGGAAHFLSYQLEQGFWRGVGRLRAVRKRIRSLSLPREERPVQWEG